LNTYGLFPKSYQLSHGCAGVKKYPLSPESNTGKPMPIAEYTAHSEALFSYVSWVDLANSEAVFNVNFNPTNLLNVVKDHLNKGQRIVFGTLIDPTQGNAGAAGTKQKRYDSWVLNDVIRKKAKKGALNAGHEMIIIGYDDNATSRDSDGVVSKGLLILRNSWGSQAGDGGTFYMSYDYFKTLADEAQAIVSNDDLR
jgi:aminopeptidase C